VLVAAVRTVLRSSSTRTATAAAAAAAASDDIIIGCVTATLLRGGKAPAQRAPVGLEAPHGRTQRSRRVVVAARR